MKIIYAFTALLFGFGKSKLVAFDHATELENNTQLAAATDEHKKEALAQEMNNVVARLKILRRNLGLSVLSMGSASGMAYLTSTYSIGITVSGNTLVVSSALCFSIATLGRLGWAGQSFGGRTSVEHLDNFIFHLLYWFGMYFAVVSAL